MIDRSTDRAVRPTSDAGPRRYLVVANLTLCGGQLAAKVRRSLRAGPCHFHLVVPASADQHRLTWTEEDVSLGAEARLKQALRAFRALGADVSGEVGDWSPMLAMDDAIRNRAFDEIIVSTLPPGVSRWVRMDLAHRAARRFGLPVSHVVSPAGQRADGGTRSRPDAITYRSSWLGVGEPTRPSA